MKAQFVDGLIEEKSGCKGVTLHGDGMRIDDGIQCLSQIIASIHHLYNDR